VIIPTYSERDSNARRDNAIGAGQFSCSSGHHGFALCLLFAYDREALIQANSGYTS
jgi:hypothetical protein